jgi:hypothetical protein
MVTATLGLENNNFSLIPCRLLLSVSSKASFIYIDLIQDITCHALGLTVKEH